MCSSARRPPTCRTPPRAAALDARPVELLVLTCLVVGIFRRRWSVRCWPPPRCQWSAALPQYSLAIWHGWNAPMIMSLMAMSGGIVLYLLLRKQLKRGRFQPAADRRFNGKRLFEQSGAPDALARRRTSDTRRLQTQLFMLVLAAFSPASCPCCTTA
jgi:multicomponent K+:H+ antiporter subunit A